MITLPTSLAEFMQLALTSDSKFLDEMIWQQLGNISQARIDKWFVDNISWLKDITQQYGEMPTTGTIQLIVLGQFHYAFHKLDFVYVEVLKLLVAHRVICSYTCCE